ncbi:MAG: dipeptide ABC transporter ATP-binding protein [Yersiniaceae bacterium]|uniref:ABC-type dipeptide transporter n=1 Tax=Chimaeribacter coloradensis TaxID=2060068 RepID=A0A2N5E6F0_9GAMM|nr:dipeptide ABC transporter ATP-binding protein [Chimaeribacter coloradensis]MDU6409639.1 dipeptide ABC transporter ATP-binding protein [Yersiniaceae bacterium]PLR36900.1 dipeptide ABC transporter ATP-binding protein [Chimaeribacter coloradensis]
MSATETPIEARTAPAASGKTSAANKTLLTVDQLSVHFGEKTAPFRAVDRISYQVKQGEVLGIVGESGSGKSVSSLAIMGLIDFPGRVMAERLEFNGRDLQQISEKERRQLVGSDVAMIFQDPMTSLNPCYTVGYQIMEALKVHQGGNKKTRRQRTIDLLTQVGIPDPASRLDVYPHQLSGGMSQRVMIAMAIACRPQLLIADEPTTALDVTIQAQIIELLLELQQRENMALILITHDLALVAESAHQIIVMYAGQVVEVGKAEEIFRAPRHPYTQALLRALPEFSTDKARLASLPGVVPGKYDRPTGCLLNPRCPYATDHCRAVEPALRQIPGRQSKCHYPLDDAGRPTYDH